MYVKSVFSEEFSLSDRICAVPVLAWHYLDRASDAGHARAGFVDLDILNTVSVIIVLVAVGLSVDYSVHI
jgi:hypothetical protein